MKQARLSGQVTRTLTLAALFAGPCVLAHAPAPAGAAQTLAARQHTPASLLLEVPSNPNHAEPAELTVLSFEYDAAAQRTSYRHGYGSNIAGSFLLPKGDPVPILAQSTLPSLEVRETNDDSQIFRHVVFHDVRVLTITREGDGRRLEFTAGSVTVR